ncbi:MAG: hypothetical protein HY808_10965 [Nitrospirae bacterium]|nr:hypothetical protein [Nitrospirota bacterium]
MLNVPVPYEKLLLFQESIGLDSSELKKLGPFKSVFVSRKQEFADYFYNVFLGIPETKLILEHVQIPGVLRKAWAGWFEMLFSSTLDNEFIARLWKIGLRHVEVNLDQRYSNLGFSVARQFCQNIVFTEVPPDQAGAVSQLVNKLLDFCLLIETSAYIEATSRCDIEIIKGIADKIRNRVIVIGGFIRRLHKKSDVNDPAYGIYNSLIMESVSCERMVSDIKTYFDIYEKDPKIMALQLDKLIRNALDRLQVKEKFSNVKIDVRLDASAPQVLGDREEIENVFFHILENSLEAVDRKDPLIQIFSIVNDALPNRVRIEIFNTGIPPGPEDMEKIFSPFYSTKPLGTGFGLAISKLALKKNYGSMTIEPVPEEGTRVIMILSTP